MSRSAVQCSAVQCSADRREEGGLSQGTRGPAARRAQATFACVCRAACLAEGAVVAVVAVDSRQHHAALREGGEAYLHTSTPARCACLARVRPRTGFCGLHFYSITAGIRDHTFIVILFVRGRVCAAGCVTP